MLHVLRLFGLLLGLSFLTGLAAVDFSSRGNTAVISPHWKFSTASGTAAPQVRLGPHARLGSTHARLITAELEDGPEGEEAPVAIFVNFYDGDDQMQAAFNLLTIALGAGAAIVAADRLPPPNHAAFSRFPTGPPAV